MRVLFLVLIVSSCSITKSSQSTGQNFLNNILNENKLYIVCRATTSKSGLIAQKFNLKDREITHCGLGFFQKKSFKIYNVSDIAGNDASALIIDSYSSFINVKGICYVSIWELNTERKLLKRVTSICKEYQDRKIDFDFGFTIKNDNSLYCSEFCATVLNKANSDYFSFAPTTIKFEEQIYKSFLNRDTLVYYPVDFFQKNLSFKKVYEYKIHK